SFKAAGQFEPSGIYEEYEADEGRNILADYLRRSRNRIVELGDASRWPHYGIALRRNYTLNHRIPAFDTHTPLDVVPKPRTGTLPFRSLNVAGREYRTWLINPTILLPRLVSDLKRSSVPFRPQVHHFRGSLPHPTQPLCTLRVRRRRRLTQHSLSGGLLRLTWAGLAPADHASFAGAFDHSITSSARASSVAGTSRPSVLAVFKLITSSNLVGACTGRFAGFSPARMRATYGAARRYKSITSAPYEIRPPEATKKRKRYSAGRRCR